MTTTLDPLPDAAPPGECILSDELLARCRSRAAGYDRDNVFFTEDFEDLRAVGYLTAPVPVELGGWGLDLAQLACEQRRLARYAPATALALSMHFYFVGIAAELYRLGDRSVEWMLRDAAAGEVFAAGHAESGNDISVLFSTATAERVDGGYRITGRKHFGSLSPVWTRFGFHAVDPDHPGGPHIVHGFLSREDGDFEVVETWDTLGMRATQSHDTVLSGAFVPDARIACVTPVGDNSHPFVAVMFVWALTLISNVYVGLAERAFELGVEGVRSKTSVAVQRGSLAYHPMLQHQIAEMYLELDAVRAVVDRLAADWVAGVDHGDYWGRQVASAKWRAASGAKRIAAVALDVAGGGAFFKRNELERLYRDAAASGFHPTTDAFTHELVGKLSLGVMGDGARW